MPNTRPVQVVHNPFKYVKIIKTDNDTWVNDSLLNRIVPVMETSDPRDSHVYFPINPPPVGLSPILYRNQCEDSTQEECDAQLIANGRDLSFLPIFVYIPRTK